MGKIIGASGRSFTTVVSAKRPGGPGVATVRPRPMAVAMGTILEDQKSIKVNGPFPQTGVALYGAGGAFA